jgi:hypothetical protein
MATTNSNVNNSSSVTSSPAKILPSSSSSTVQSATPGVNDRQIKSCFLFL